jgi:hypothetical protein
MVLLKYFFGLAPVLFQKGLRQVASETAIRIRKIAVRIGVPTTTHCHTRLFQNFYRRFVLQDVVQNLDIEAFDAV